MAFFNNGYLGIYSQMSKINIYEYMEFKVIQTESFFCPVPNIVAPTWWDVLYKKAMGRGGGESLTLIILHTGEHFYKKNNDAVLMFVGED